MRTTGILLAVFLVAAASSAQIAPTPEGFPAEKVFLALEKSYPGWVIYRQTGQVPILSVGGSDFVWAEGRLLPPRQAEHWADFAPQPFYKYPSQIPDVASWSDDRVADAEARLASRRSTPPRRESVFFDTLWGIHDRGTADAAQKRIRFLGLPVTVHRSLEAVFLRIQARLEAARADDPTLDAFLRTLVRLEGYNWRDIAETQSRSNHAYGAAIDLIPRSYGNRAPYWLWAPQEHPGWYRTAWLHRWEPHPAVVKAFEDEGFVWGGKWLLFDTIHFEYRPEILALSGYGDEATLLRP
jgi:hypothetical protein